MKRPRPHAANRYPYTVASHNTGPANDVSCGRFTKRPYGMTHSGIAVAVHTQWHRTMPGRQTTYPAGVSRNAPTGMTHTRTAIGHCTGRSHTMASRDTRPDNVSVGAVREPPTYARRKWAYIHHGIAQRRPGKRRIRRAFHETPLRGRHIRASRSGIASWHPSTPGRPTSP